MIEQYVLGTAHKHTHRLTLRDGAWYVRVNELERQVIALLDETLFDGKMTPARFAAAQAAGDVYIPCGLSELDLPEFYARKPILANNPAELEAFKAGVKIGFGQTAPILSIIPRDATSGQYLAAR
jgi:hypothetical protein